VSVYDRIKKRIAERYADLEFAKRMGEAEARIKTLELSERLYYRRQSLLRWRVPEATWPHLDAPQATDAWRASAAFLEADAAEERFLVLAGPRGRGKTVAESWMVAQLSGRYFLAQDLVRLSSFDRALWDELSSVALLAIDDLGSERGNDEFDANLYALLDGRFRRLRKTALATNLTASQFRERYASGPMARLHERLVTGGEWVNLPGVTMRAVGAP